MCDIPVMMELARPLKEIVQNVTYLTSDGKEFSSKKEAELYVERKHVGYWKDQLVLINSRINLHKDFTIPRLHMRYMKYKKMKAKEFRALPGHETLSAAEARLKLSQTVYEKLELLKVAIKDLEDLRKQFAFAKEKIKSLEGECKK